MKVLCEDTDCKHCSADVCTAGTIKLDLYGSCCTFNPIHCCGECAKFHTEACSVKYPELIQLMEEDNAANLDCFEERSEDDAEAD